MVISSKHAFLMVLASYHVEWEPERTGYGRGPAFPGIARVAKIQVGVIQSVKNTDMNLPTGK